MATIRGASQRVVRVIGVGAEARGDDAAGLLVARLLGAAAPPDVEILESAGDAGDLLTLLEDADRVLVVDGGRIVEDGPPASLRTGTGAYGSLHRAWLDSLA